MVAPEVLALRASLRRSPWDFRRQRKIVSQPQPSGPAPVNVATVQANLQVGTVESQGTASIAHLAGNPNVATNADSGSRP